MAESASIAISVGNSLPEYLADRELGGDHVIVTPGQVITTESDFLRGHGTYVEQSTLLASVAGEVQRVNKLICVKPPRSRYIGEVGDIVIGRITEVGNKRWKVDINGRRDAMLMLASVNLPGGVQRRRTYEDQLQMRSFFQENDLISAEVQEVRHDGVVMLHTRSLKYGKLENGQFIKVPSALIRRLKQHTLKFRCGVDAIIGNNGNIWLTYKQLPQDTPESQGSKNDEDDTYGPNAIAESAFQMQKIHAATEIPSADREKICRLHNAIRALATLNSSIHPELIEDIYSNSLEANMEARDILSIDFLNDLASRLAGFQDDQMDETN